MLIVSKDYKDWFIVLNGKNKIMLQYMKIVPSCHQLKNQVAEQNTNDFQLRTRNDICKYIKLNIQTFLYNLFYSATTLYID